MALASLSRASFSAVQRLLALLHRHERKPREDERRRRRRRRRGSSTSAAPPGAPGRVSRAGPPWPVRRGPGSRAAHRRLRRARRVVVRNRRRSQARDSSGVEGRLSIPQAAQVVLVDQAGGQRAVHLAERQMGQQDLEPLRVGPGVAQGGERGASAPEELGRRTALGRRSGAGCRPGR